MPSSAQAKRDYYKAVLGATTVATALADLEAEYFSKAATGAISSGPLATTAVAGNVKRMTTVADIPAQTVTDIATAQTAVNTIVAKINALLAAARVAGQL